MKDKILEILLDKIKATPHDYYPTGIEGIPQSSREISYMVKAFTEWKDLNTMTDRITRYKIQYMISDMNIPAIWMNFDELFDYWYANIKDK
jgi:hypothetical protein